MEQNSAKISYYLSAGQRQLILPFCQKYSKVNYLIGLVKMSDK